MRQTKLLPILIGVIASLVFAAPQKNAMEDAVIGHGLGFHLGIAAPDKGVGKYYVNDGNGFAVGFHKDIRLGIKEGKGGEVHCSPNITFWYRRDKWTTPNIYMQNPISYMQEDKGVGKITLSDWQMSINFLEVRYFPPMPISSVRPYAGFSLPNLTLYRYREEITSTEKDVLDDVLYERKELLFHAGADFVMGFEFRPSSRTNPFVEFRFSGGEVHSFQFLAGINFVKR